MIRIIQCAAIALLCATMSGRAATVYGIVTLAGDVADPVTPVRGASVVAYKMLTNQSGQDSARGARLDSVLTDADGAYSITNLKAGRIYLEAGMKGYTLADPRYTGTLPSDTGRYIVNFLFQDTAQAQLRVKVLRDSAQGHGLAGATLTLSKCTSLGRDCIPLDTAKTDANGEYTFKQFPGEYQLSVRMAGFMESFHQGSPGVLDLHRLKTVSALIVLWPNDGTGAIAGKVTKASDGSAVAGAKAILSRSAPSDPSGYVALDSAATASDGSYKFGDVPVARDYAVTVKSTGYQTAVAKPFDVSFDRTFLAPISLFPPSPPADSVGTVSGVVDDSAGNGLAGARVILMYPLKKDWDTVFTDAQGRFTFPKAGWSLYSTLDVSRPGYAIADQIDCQVVSGQTRILYVTLQKLPASGVVDKAGHETLSWHAGPAGGIVLEMPADSRSGRVRIYDIRGAIRFSSTLRSGATRVEIPWSGRRTGYMVVERGTEFHRFVVPPAP